MIQLTAEMAKHLPYRKVLAVTGRYNADGTCMRWRVNGAVKLWKTRPNEFRIPIKYGLNGGYDYITQDNYQMFHLNGTCEKCG